MLDRFVMKSAQPWGRVVDLEDCLSLGTPSMRFGPSVVVYVKITSKTKELRGD